MIKTILFAYTIGFTITFLLSVVSHAQTRTTLFSMFMDSLAFALGWPFFIPYFYSMGLIEENKGW